MNHQILKDPINVKDIKLECVENDDEVKNEIEFLQNNDVKDEDIYESEELQYNDVMEFANADETMQSDILYDNYEHLDEELELIEECDAVEEIDSCQNNDNTSKVTVDDENEEYKCKVCGDTFTSKVRRSYLDHFIVM